MAVIGEVLCCVDKCNLHKDSSGDIVVLLENANFSCWLICAPFHMYYLWLHLYLLYVVAVMCCNNYSWMRHSVVPV